MSIEENIQTESEADKKKLLINQTIEESTQVYHEFLESLFDSPLKVSPFKSMEQQIKERENQIQEFMKCSQESLQIGISSFLAEAQPEEKSELARILNKIGSIFSEIAGIREGDYITEQECLFLEEIAKRQLIKGQYFESSCMYRLLVMINVIFGKGWVGWAISEQELGNAEVVDMIFQLALTIDPDQHYIALFAADYYGCVNQRNKAIEILENSKKRLIEDHQEDSKTYECVQESLMSFTQ